MMYCPECGAQIEGTLHETIHQLWGSRRARMGRFGMDQNELTETEKYRMLAMAVRNNYGQDRTPFTPIDGVHLCYREGDLCHVSPRPIGDTGFIHICKQEDALEMDEEELWHRVMEVKSEPETTP